LAQQKVYIKNKPATFEYAIEDKLTAGIMLTGSEIKSVRDSKVSFNDSYCFFHNGELWIRSLYIAEYVNAGYAGHDPVRERKLLLNKKEMRKWETKGKKLHDKRETMKSRDAEREMKRYLKR
jgi:SsrA-binding protein